MKKSETIYIGGAGNVLCRREFELEKATVAVITLAADPHSYARTTWQPLRGDGCDGNWLPGGSYLKFRLYLDGQLIGIGPFRPLRDGIGVEHCFTVPLPPGRHTIAVISRGERNGFALTLQAGKLRLVSDESWKVFPANEIYAPVCWEKPEIDNFFKGGPGPGEYPEHLDGRQLPEGWLRSGFDDSAWSNAVVTARNLPVEPVDWNFEVHRVKPEQIRKTADGRYLIDFGKEMIGGIELTGSPGGGAVELRLAEEMLDADHIRYQMRTGNCYQELWRFRPGGQRLSHFGLRIFRFAEVVDYTGELTPEHIQLLTVRAPFSDSAGDMQSSSADLNRIWELGKYTIKATTTDLYTDCFSRERICYEADSLINMRSALTVDYQPRPARRSIEYLIHHPTWPCEWLQLIIPLAYEYYLHTGDRDFLERNFDELVTRCSYHPLIKDGLIRSFPRMVIIDWPQDNRDDYDMHAPAPTVPNVLAWYDLQLLGKLASYLGRGAGGFIDSAASMREAINRQLFDTATGLYRDGLDSTHYSFHANMFALWSGIVPEANQQYIAGWLAGRGMACSLYGAQFLLETLFRYGQEEAAFKLLLSDGPRSWLNMLNHGATMTTEVFDLNADYAMSWAHPWGTSPVNLIARQIFGLRPTAPGWKSFEFLPLPGPLSCGKLRQPVPGGTIECSFKRRPDGSLETDLTTDRPRKRVPAERRAVYPPVREKDVPELWMN